MKIIVLITLFTLNSIHTFKIKDFIGKNLTAEKISEIVLRRNDGKQAPFLTKKIPVENRFMIKFKDHLGFKDAVQFMSRSEHFDDSLFIHHKFHELSAVAVTMKQRTRNLFRLFDEVEYVIQDSIVTIEQSSKDFFCSKDIQANAGWCLSRLANRNENQTFRYPRSAGEGVTVYVLDSGIEANHSEFEDRATFGTSFVDEEPNIDLNGHGTACASLAVGRTVGIARKARVVGVKILDRIGSGVTSNIVAGLLWCLSEHLARNNGEAIISASVGGDFDPLVNSAAEYVVKRGMFLVVAAGNDAVDACRKSAASEPFVFTVAASNIGNRLASFSNYGTCVDMTAPGVNCKAAWLNNDYADGDGTSIATPYVAGWAAVMQGCMHFKTPEKLANYLIQHSRKGFIEGGENELKGTPNNFINLDCPWYCL